MSREDQEYEGAVQELHDALTRLAPYLLGDGEGALISEWTLVVGYVTPEGETLVDLICPENMLQSHILGALELGAEVTRKRIREEP